MSTFAQLPFELQLKIFAYHKPIEAVLVLSKAVFYKLGPPYYRSVTFRFSYAETVISEFIKPASEVCLSSVRAIRVDFADRAYRNSLPELRYLRMFVDTIDMLGKLPNLKVLKISPNFDVEDTRRLRIWDHFDKYFDGIDWEQVYDTKSGDTTELWLRIETECGIKNPAGLAKDIQTYCATWKVESYLQLMFSYEHHDELVDRPRVVELGKDEELPRRFNQVHLHQAGILPQK